MGRPRRGPGTIAALAITALALSGCAGSGPADVPEPGTTVLTPSTPPSPTPDAVDDEPDDDGDDGDGDGAGVNDLPGEAFIGGPEEGAQLAVVGVRADDVLNLRAGPGVSFDVVAELAPLEAEVMATGRSRWLDGMSSVWVEATVDGVTGWANSRFLAYLGQVDDVTAALGAPAGGSELVDVAERVAQQWSGDTEGWATVTVVDGPHHGDMGEVTVDVLGMGDDSVMGVRLHIFATPDGGRFTARTIEATLLCARGVDDGRCI